MNCFLEESETVVVSATSSCGARGERLSSSSALFANDHGAELLELFSDEQVFHRALVMSLTLSDFSATCMQEALSTRIVTVSSPVSYFNDHCESVALTFFHRAVNTANDVCIKCVRVVAVVRVVVRVGRVLAVLCAINGSATML